ncbi:MAG: hypothetical protein L0H64_20140 [Pseudonocardia sp.]|nr:hypothetical protein [Pseudonocardia sp.]
MTTSTSTSRTLSHRDRSVLAAVLAGRCEVAGGAAAVLVIDGLGCCDQFAGPRLVRAGLIAPPGPTSAPARLTATGHALLAAA